MPRHAEARRLGRQPRALRLQQDGFVHVEPPGLERLAGRAQHVGAHGDAERASRSRLPCTITRDEIVGDRHRRQRRRDRFDERTAPGREFAQPGGHGRKAVAQTLSDEGGKRHERLPHAG
jgi:hypothetical protein